MVDTVLAAVDVAAVVFSMRGRFARRHLLETLCGQKFTLGLDNYRFTTRSDAVPSTLSGSAATGPTGGIRG